jgi:hypothetical protein
MTDSLEAMAFNMKDQVNDIYSCSWGPDDNGKTVDGPHQLAQVYKTALYLISHTVIHPASPVISFLAPVIQKPISLTLG